MNTHISRANNTPPTTRNPRMQTPSRSCRGEWKLARNTRNASISHAGDTTIPPQGRYAGELPLAPTLHIYMPTQPPHVQCRNTSTTCKPIACKPHRVAVGASGSSPATHAMHPFSPRRRHNNTTTGSIRGRASTRPYTAYTCQYNIYMPTQPPPVHATTHPLRANPPRAAAGIFQQMLIG